MFQIPLDHLLGHLPHRRAEIPPSPKVLTRIALLQLRKFLEKLARSHSHDPSHNLALRHHPCRIDQNMHIVLSHHTLRYPNLKRFARLPDQLSETLSNIPSQNLVAIPRHPYKMVSTW